METGKEFERENENYYNSSDCGYRYDEWGHFIDLDLEYRGNQHDSRIKSSVCLKIKQEICESDDGDYNDCEFIMGNSKNKELFIRLCIICITGLYALSLCL